MSRARLALALPLSALLVCGVGCQAAEVQWLPASPAKLPRWRGFNLLEKFMVHSNKPFVEKDFVLLQRLGFNFVRLPMDYRCWIVGGDWERFNEKALAEIDQAVAYGARYGIHIMLNFHRAPGYTVANPPEAKKLWTDPDAQRVCALHWATFARRYRGIPNTRLSFNLFNEPAGVEPARYVAVVRPIVEAIRREDPDRLIVSDGLQWGREPVPALLELKLAQATRGYEPFQLTHYKASWVGGADRFPLPTWPRVVASGLLVNPTKPDMSEGARRPLVLTGPFPAVKALRLRVGTVSGKATLVVKADGAEVWRKEFVCGPGEGEWKEVKFQAQWNLYQNVYDRDYETPVAPEAKKLEVAVVAGDWLNLTQLSLVRADGEHKLALSNDWNRQPAELGYQPGAATGPFQSRQVQDNSALRRALDPWQAWERSGGGVMVGEWGSYNQTPHDVTLRWMEDCLKLWREAGWGWALWNFRGSFGVLDSGRKDVAYEDLEGHKLDRKMLDLLQRY